VLAQHLHVRMLDQLAGAAGREKGHPLGFPGVSNGVSAGNGLGIAALGLAEKSTLTKPRTSNFRDSR
jgi:hypothetical protein